MTTYDDGPNPNLYFLLESEPMIINSADGPLLHFSDGQLHWLTWRERFLVYFGMTDADGLQRKLRPNLTAALEMMSRRRVPRVQAPEVDAKDADKARAERRRAF